MPIQLDKILADIADEKTLHPNYPNAPKKQTDDAWLRVGKKNKLSVHECRSIFKVLQKKYEQERIKETSAWKLFNVMDEIHKKVEIKAEVKHEIEQETPMEEDEEYEMLEVQEEEEHSAAAAMANYAAASSAPNAGSGSPTQSESPNKSMKSNSSTGSPERDEKPLLRNLIGAASQKTPAPSTPQVEERKILNSLPTIAQKNNVGSTAATTTTPSAAAAAALQKKGITMKKTVPTTPTGASKMTTGAITAQNNNKTTPVRGNNCTLLEVGKTIQLPESIKRKLSEDHTTHTQNKRSNLSQAAVAAATAAQQATSSNNTSPSQVTTLQGSIKQEREPEILAAQTQTSHGINLITIPANPTRNDLTNGVGAGGSLIVGAGSAGPTSSTAATVASTSTNGYSPRLEEIDFRNDIIFDAGNGHGINGGNSQQQAVNRVNHHRTSEIINLGNFDQSLPPTFFKNLCNSSRHEALGLYVANVMNRLGTRSAAKLELGILRAIIDVQSDELEQ